MPYRGRRPKRPPQGSPQHAWDAYAEDVRFYLSEWEPEDDLEEYRPSVNGVRGAQPEDVETPISHFVARRETREDQPPEGTNKRRDPESIFYRGER